MVPPLEQLDVTTVLLDRYAQSLPAELRPPSASLSPLIFPIPAFSGAPAPTRTLLDDYWCPLAVGNWHYPPSWLLYRITQRSVRISGGINWTLTNDDNTRRKSASLLQLQHLHSPALIPPSLSPIEMPVSPSPIGDPRSPVPNLLPAIKLPLNDFFAPRKEQREEEVANVLDSPAANPSPELNRMVEADTASVVARKCDGSGEWRNVMRMAMQV